MHGEPSKSHDSHPITSWKARHSGSVIDVFFQGKVHNNVEPPTSRTLAVLCGLGWHSILSGHDTFKPKNVLKCFEILSTIGLHSERNNQQFSEKINSIHLSLNPSALE